MSEKIFDKLTILENSNWKGLFKDGQFFIGCFRPNLNGYTIFGLNTERKPRLICRFMLKEDIDKCTEIKESTILEPFIEERKLQNGQSTN